ncbi:protein GLUTAMINE DUMPER 6-like [Cucurbita pepo subsp. pepo]|uniref:protein GLUTAMINE DUMPER 6-like n=1 Tax=Cucurbita pepo subsp. pepo TaxID=3664 RepID=UPI000C9D5CA8|nr:protein GLUTAMINE DUMPER 6-like [Cucurbita pepo subsp. pepo]
MRGMRSLAASASAMKTGHYHFWNTSVPYLFGAITLTLLLILTALIFLVCSCRKHSSSSDEEDQKTKIDTPSVAADDPQPKIVVIMAGNHTPTFLATATPSDSSNFSRSTERF